MARGRKLLLKTFISDRAVAHISGGLLMRVVWETFTCVSWSKASVLFVLWLRFYRSDSATITESQERRPFDPVSGDCSRRERVT